MIQFFTSDANIIFIASLGLMCLIGAAEAVSLLSGFGLSQVVDSWLPEADILDGGVELPHAGALDTPASVESVGSSASIITKFIGWIRFGKVPVLMILVIFLTVFGLSGVGVQLLMKELLGFYLPSLISVPTALAISLPLTRLSSIGISKIIPRDESSAITNDSFIGRMGTIVLGTAKRGVPAQAKIRDQHGQHHYVMVEPDEGQSDIPVGGRVILVKRAGSKFICITDDTES